MQGWIKLHRELMSKAIWLESTCEQKVILIALLMMANHQGKEWEWKGERYKAEPGQFVTSLESIAKNCGSGISIKNVRTALKRFENYDFLANQSTNKNRLITIANWEKYQANDDEGGKQTGKQRASKRQASGKQRATNKNEENVKNDKNVRIKEYTSNPLLIESLNDFIEMRKQIKSPLTDKALTLMLNKLDKLGSSDQEKIDMLNQSIMNSWKGVFPLKGGNHERSPQNGKQYNPDELSL